MYGNEARPVSPVGLGGLAGGGIARDRSTFDVLDERIGKALLTLDEILRGLDASTTNLGGHWRNPQPTSSGAVPPTVDGYAFAKLSNRADDLDRQVAFAAEVADRLRALV